MKKSTRAIVAVFAFIIGYILWNNTHLLGWWHPPTNTVSNLTSCVFGIAFSSFFWWLTGKLSQELLDYILKGGFIVGGIGLFGGSFVPMLFRPDCSLCFIIGLFFTGPLGFLLGLIIGGVFGKIKLKT